MSKQLKPFWNKRIGSIQEPYPHHTTLCLRCGYLYNRTNRKSNKCPKCGHIYSNIKSSEFYVGKKKIYFGKNLELKRKILR